MERGVPAGTPSAAAVLLPRRRCVPPLGRTGCKPVTLGLRRAFLPDRGHRRLSELPGLGAGGGAGGRNVTFPGRVFTWDEDGGADGPATAAVVAVRRDGTA